MRKLLAVLLAAVMMLTLVLAAGAASSESQEASSGTSASESAESAPEESSESSKAPLYTYEEAFAQMTTMDYVTLFGVFFASMLVAMVLYGALLKYKAKKKVDKYRRP